jgi:hypothetical protein
MGGIRSWGRSRDTVDASQPAWGRRGCAQGGGPIIGSRNRQLARQNDLAAGAEFERFVEDDNFGADRHVVPRECQGGAHNRRLVRHTDQGVNSVPLVSACVRACVRAWWYEHVSGCKQQDRHASCGVHCGMLHTLSGLWDRQIRTLVMHALLPTYINLIQTAYKCLNSLFRVSPLKDIFSPLHFVFICEYTPCKYVDIHTHAACREIPRQIQHRRTRLDIEPSEPTPGAERFPRCNSTSVPN